jgi:beta-glucosidase
VPAAVRDGIIDLNIPGLEPILRKSPDLLGTFDYLGLNYYRRTDLRLDDLGGFGVRSYTPSGEPQSELGWEIYARGFYEMLQRCAGYGWPIMITENGVADATDALRPGYLRAHVYALQLAMQAGVDVRGYYFWTLADNYELTSGYTQKLGLFTVDPDDPALQRVPKASAETFRDIARAMGRTPKDELP